MVGLNLLNRKYFSMIKNLKFYGAPLKLGGAIAHNPTRTAAYDVHMYFTLLLAFIMQQHSILYKS